MKNTTKSQIEKFIQNNENLAHMKKDIEKTMTVLINCIANGKKILCCGNGGSCSDCEHISGELLKSFKLKRTIEKIGDTKICESNQKLFSSLQGGIKCIPLTSFSALNSAFANDCNFEYVFAQLLNVLGDNGDVLLAVSTSGNSKNVLHACEVAKMKGIKVVGLLGGNGGKVVEQANVSLISPKSECFEVQEDHIKLYHLLCLCLENEFFEN
ncbi:MAG: SIS domain-containing protein [Clostridia bacterium]